MKTAQLVNLLIVAALSVGLGTASVFVFPQTDSGPKEGWILAGGISWNKPIEFTQTGLAKMNGRDHFSVFEGSEATINWDENSQVVEVSLSKGSVYYSTLAGDFSVEIVTPFSRVNSQNSAAFVSLDADSLTLSIYSLNHPNLVTFTADDEDLNALLIPSDRWMKIPSSKVSSTLARLRLAKLSKEFQVFEYETDAIPEEVLLAFEDGKAMYEAGSLEVLNLFRKGSDFGPAMNGIGGALTDGYGFIRDVLTVLPSAEQRLAGKLRDSAFTYAYTNLLYGDRMAGETWTEQWKTADHNAEEVVDIYRSLFFVLPGDDLYPLKATAAEILYPDQEPLSALRRQFQEIESLLDAGFQVEAQSAYQDYQGRFEAALNAGDFDDPNYLDDISREYVLLELLLRSYSVFYSNDAIKLLSELEEKILALSGDKDLDEERQAFVQSKIRFLDNLFDYVTQRKISVEDASKLGTELISEAESYLNSIGTQVAVMDYFESKLEEFDLSLAFMNSPEFYSYDSFEDGLKDYRAKKQNLDDLNEYLQTIRTGEEEVASISLEDAISEVEKDMRTNGVQYAEIVSLGDSANRLFQIDGARTGGYAFEANYDRETQILYDVVVNGIRFSTGLTLEVAQDIIAQTAAELEPIRDDLDEESTVSEETDETVVTSLAESVAILRVEAELEDAGFEVADFDIVIVDLNENVFAVEGLLAEWQISVSGTFDLDTGELSEIVWEYAGEIASLEDTDLSQLENVLLEAAAE